MVVLLLLHCGGEFQAPEALLQTEHFNAAARVDLVHGVERLPARLSVQVVALEEDTVVAEAAHKHAAVVLVLELDTLADVRPRLLARARPLHVGQGAQAKAVLSWRVEEAVYGHR